MLNELFTLAGCLQSVDVSTDSWHPYFKQCPVGATTYKAMLDGQGRVVDLRAIKGREQIGGLRKWEVELGVSFPGFNVLPLYKPLNDEAETSAAQFRKSLASKSPPDASKISEAVQILITQSQSLWDGNENKRVTKCLTTHAVSLADRLKSLPSEGRAILELIRRAGLLAAGCLHQQLQQLLLRDMIGSPPSAASIFDAVFQTGKTPKRFSLILELVDSSQHEYPANHEVVQRCVNRELLSAMQSSAGESQGRDAFGNPAKSLSGKFPKVRLPILGDVILRAMSKESPCQQRYGVADELSCPVDQTSRMSMKNALEWLADSTRKSCTWADVRGTCGFAKRAGKKVAIPAILFAYPSRLPPQCPEIAGLLAGSDDQNDPDGVRFENYAEPVATALKGIVKNHPDTEVCVFVLVKVDKARTKVVQTQRFYASHLLSCAADWQREARNIPPIAIRQFGANKEDSPYWTAPHVPFPTEVAICLSTAWQQDGTHAEEVAGFGIGDALALLLEKGTRLRTVAVQALRAALVHSTRLLLALGQSHHRSQVHVIGKKYAKHPLLLPGILGLLLAKLGRLKGEYMKGPPFLVGRLLSLSDQLHVQYCLGVRDGQIPPRLVGNALMPTALDQPAKALALLSQRLLPYKAWATAVREGENVGLTKYLLGQLGRVSADLAELDLPKTSTDTEKAEMLLGYLAHSEKETVTTPPTNSEGANL